MNAQTESPNTDPGPAAHAAGVLLVATGIIANIVTALVGLLTILAGR